jgi:2-oxoglutarate dehydrogenase E1 component
MGRQDANDVFAQTSFLYGGNAAYIEDLYARYQANPASVDADWQAFFGALKDEAGDAAKEVRGASWQKPNWPIHANGELISALDGNWAVVETRCGP